MSSLVWFLLVCVWGKVFPQASETDNFCRRSKLELLEVGIASYLSHLNIGARLIFSARRLLSCGSRWLECERSSDPHTGRRFITKTCLTIQDHHKQLLILFHTQVEFFFFNKISIFNCFEMVVVNIVSMIVQVIFVLQAFGSHQRSLIAKSAIYQVFRIYFIIQLHLKRFWKYTFR